MVQTIMEAVLGALACGATDGVKDVAKGGLIHGYNKLKTAFEQHSEVGTGVSSALEQLEAKPESKARQAVLAEELDASGITTNGDVLATATSLLHLVRSLGIGSTGSQVASGTGIAQASHGSSATVTMTDRQT